MRQDLFGSGYWEHCCPSESRASSHAAGDAAPVTQRQQRFGEMSVPLCQRQQLLSDDSHGNDLRPPKGQEKESVRR